MCTRQDKINAFWEITKKDLDDKKAELRNKDREMEEMEERHQVEIKVYKQKVKHLLYEHQNNITTLKADGELALKLQQDEFRKREAELNRDKRDLKLKLKEQVCIAVMAMAGGMCPCDARSLKMLWSCSLCSSVRRLKFHTFGLATSLQLQSSLRFWLLAFPCHLVRSFTPVKRLCSSAP